MGKGTPHGRGGYHAVHIWMNAHFPRIGRCEYCARIGRTEYASIGHTYTRNRTDWFELCARCHDAFDGHPAARYRLGKTHCPGGHPYSGRNLHIDKKGARRCRRCAADRARARGRRVQGVPLP